ncbi:MAG TPA: circularly permuted type 2 ATP-grasp protein [Solirubrobacterales bacterium]|nr:circularly permuted type 2 ATP-grasp protein [Solirubrobacterales bacterium]
MKTSAAPGGSANFDDYPVTGEGFDEAFAAPGRPRDHYEGILAALEDCDLKRLASRAAEEIERLGADFGDDQGFRIDPVPRLFTGPEWERIELGLVQRARAINAFVADAYGDQRGFGDGPFPRRLLETSPGYEPMTQGLLDPDAHAAVVCGMDLVRGADGRPMVLEDNLRTPSGLAYAEAARKVITGLCDWPLRPRPHEDFAVRLGAALRASAPDPASEPSIAVLSEGSGSDAWFEQTRLADGIGGFVVTPADLSGSAAGLRSRIEGRERPVDVVYRRVDDPLTGPDGAPTPLGELLGPPLRSGRLRCVNAFGTGLADDKLAHAYSEEMIRFYLGEEPILASVPTLDAATPEAAEALAERPEELVIKPRGGYGGQGVVLLGSAAAEERREAIRRVSEDPGSVVIQPLVHLSTHPTVAEGRLRPRHVDLRPFVVSSAEGGHVFPGGLTRFAPGEGDMVVNSSRGGGGKDTWLVEA